jgi:hypothetical protein
LSALNGRTGKFAPRAERGTAAVILLLAILAMVVMFGATLHVESVTASLTETQRRNEERAKLNAKNAIVDADAWLEGKIVPALEDILRQAFDTKASMSSPSLVTLSFPTYSKRFPMTGSGCGPDDFADVSATVTLAGPPLQRTLEGATSSAGAVRVDEYRFRVRMTSEGHASGGRVARYRHDSTILIEVEVGPQP